MPAGSVVKLVSTSFDAFGEKDSNKEVSVTGHIDAPVRDLQSVTATVKAPGIQKGASIVFTIKNYKAPKISADADALFTGNAIEAGMDHYVESSIPDTPVVVEPATDEAAAMTVLFDEQTDLPPYSPLC